MDKLQKVSLARHQIATDCGINAAFIFDDPSYPSSLLAGELTAGERQEGQRKTAPAAYRNWLLGRLAAKAALGRLWNLPPEAVEVLKGPGGAPLARSDARPSATGWVSISHTGGAAMAAAADVPIGVDLERLDRRISPGVWRWAFSQAEQKMLGGISGRFPRELALWCAKESAGKSWGRGLLNHLHQVRIIHADWADERITVGWFQDEIRAGKGAAGACPHGGSDGVSCICQAEVRLLIYEGYMAALAEKAEPSRTGKRTDEA